MKKKLPKGYPKMGGNKGFKVTRRETKGEVRKFNPLEPTRRNIDYTALQYEHLQRVAEELGLTAQAVVKMALQEWLIRYEENKERMQQS